MDANVSRKSRSKYQPVAYSRKLASQRSHSVSDEVEHGPRDRLLSTTRRQSTVARLIERYESRKSKLLPRSTSGQERSPTESNATTIERLVVPTRPVNSSKVESLPVNSSSTSISTSDKNLTLTPSTVEKHNRRSSKFSLRSDNSKNSIANKKELSTRSSDSSSTSSEGTMKNLTITKSEAQYKDVQLFLKSQTNHMTDLSDNGFDTPPDLHQSQHEQPDKLSTDRNAQRTVLFQYLQELHATEETYVRKLFVLSSELLNKVKEACESDDSLYKNFESIYRPLSGALRRLYDFHAKSILPVIEDYKTGHRIGIIWSLFEVHFQKIEILYKEYYVLHEENQEKIQQFARENELINQGMMACLTHLDNIYPTAELNCCNQRLLRYILLMQNYIKHLNRESDEYEHTSAIHDELVRIAERCEDHLAVSPVQASKLKSRIDSKVELFDEQRLVWHGPLKKQSPRKNTDITAVYMVLFPKCILIYRDTGNKLEFRRQLSMKNLTVDVILCERILSTSLSSTDLQQVSRVNYFRFRVNAIEKSYELLIEKESQRDKWVNKIREAATEYRDPKLAIKLRALSTNSNEQSLGNRAPVWVNDVDVTRCQICHNRFGSALIHSRRHHCRSCGRCICGSCSSRRLLLKYCSRDGDVRVCDLCYATFTGIGRSSIRTSKSIRDSSRTILFGDFRCSSSKSTVWIDLQEDYQLHIYNGKLDQVEDYSINLSELVDLSLKDIYQTLVLKTEDRTYRFYIEFNHQIVYQNNSELDKKLQNTVNKLRSYTNLWFEAIKAARTKTTPEWYVRKRDSADSGISTS